MILASKLPKITQNELATAENLVLNSAAKGGNNVTTARTTIMNIMATSIRS